MQGSKYLFCRAINSVANYLWRSARNISVVFQKHYLVTMLLITGIILLGQGSYLRVKAWLAQQLIAHSWQVSRQHHGQEIIKPWPWADITAIAKLTIPELGVTQYIMSDASGEALAFGAGVLKDGAFPGNDGHSLIAGHRDSHFAFLEKIQPDEILEIENVQGKNRRYRVNNIEIIDTRQMPEVVFDNEDKLTLITCYPFDAVIPGGPLRYVVQAEAI